MTPRVCKNPVAFLFDNQAENKKKEKKMYNLTITIWNTDDENENGTTTPSMQTRETQTAKSGVRGLSKAPPDR